MTPKQFIEKAVEGGWRPKYLNDDFMSKEDDGYFTYYLNCRALLDPLAFQAVGKVEGWDEFGSHETKGNNLRCFRCGAKWDDENDCEKNPIFPAKRNMHHMIDALCEGKSIEQFLETL